MYELFCLNMNIYALCEMVNTENFQELTQLGQIKKILLFRIT